MAKKFVLTGTDNDGFRHRYSVKKIEAFKEAFVKFMVDLRFDEEKIRRSFMGFYVDENSEHIEVPLKIEEIVDVCWNYQSSKYDVDVFFGQFKIILVIRTNKRVPMVEHLEKEAHWIKQLEIKKIREERDKKRGVVVPLRKAPSVG